MSERILEKNGVDNTNIDGAGFNRFCAGNRDGIIRGILNECAAAVQGNTFTLSTGELIICGFRIVIESPIVKTFSAIPVSPITYQLVAEIQVTSSSDVQFTLKFQDVQQLIQDELFDTPSGEGTYQIELYRFIQNIDGNLTGLTAAVNIISGGTSTSKGSIVIGDVTTHTLPAGSEAQADVNEREEDGVVYTDFIFWIPQGANGKDALLYLYTYERQIDPVSNTNQTVNFAFTRFNRTPSTGDAFTFIWYNSDTRKNIKYFVTASILTIKDDTVTYIHIISFAQVSGTDGKDGTDGVGITQIIGGDPEITEGETITPITIVTSDGKEHEVEIVANNGQDALVYNALWGTLIAGSGVYTQLAAFNRTPVAGEKFVVFSSQNQYALATIESVSDTLVGVRINSPIIVTRGTNGTNGKDGVSITGATAGTPTVANGKTITPITFSFSDGSTKQVNVEATNGTDGKDATGEVKSIKINGTVYTPDSNGLVDLGTISGGTQTTSFFNDIY